MSSVPLASASKAPPNYQSFPSIDSSTKNNYHPHHPQEKNALYSLWRHIQRCCQQLVFAHAFPMMQAGNDHQLHPLDLLPLQPENATTTVFGHFRKHYDQVHEESGQDPMMTERISGGGGQPRSIFAAMASVYGPRFLLCGVGSLLILLCGLFTPIVLHHVIDAFAKPTVDLEDLSLWLGVFFVSLLVRAVVSCQVTYYVELTALHLTVSMKSLLFEKTLRLQSHRTASADADARSVTTSTATHDVNHHQQDPKKKKSEVEISNLYTADVNAILWAAFQINKLWIVPLEVFCVVYLLFAVLSYATLAGLAVVLITMVLSFFIVKAQHASYRASMQQKDLRMKALKEYFGAIQIVKLNAWESQCLGKIYDLRNREMRLLAKYLYTAGLSSFVLWTSPIGVSMTSFGVYALVMNKQLTAAKVFTSIALFNMLRDPLRDLPSVLQQCIQARVSLNRIATFLEMQEYDPSAVTRSTHFPCTGDSKRSGIEPVITIENGEFGWQKGKCVLDDVNFQVLKGDFVVIHGSVGSGKSSLVSAFLGEIPKRKGKVLVSGSIAYYSQVPWLQNMSIKDNILFGNEFDAVKYNQVLDACCLKQDLLQFPGRDQTEIGLKGVNLSGGQKARICLARACYADADIVILDSPLIAVDAVVQSEIFHRCFCRFLQNKTIVLVAYSQDIIHGSVTNNKIMVANGHVQAQRVDVTHSREIAMQSMPQWHYLEASMQNNVENDGTCSTPGSNRGSLSSMPRLTEELVLEDHIATQKAQVEGSLVVEEERQEGRVSGGVFLQYFHAIGGVRVCIWLVVVQILLQIFQIGSDLWLSHWTGASPRNTNASTSPLDPSSSRLPNVIVDRDETVYNMRVYVALGGANALMVLIRAITVATVGLHASRELFEMMTGALFHAPLSFFDANPIGRIMNRFADDVSAVDISLPTAYGSFLAFVFASVCQLATAVYAVRNLGYLILPLVWLYVKLANYSLAPSREMSRLWKVSASPMLSHVSQCEEGKEVLRAFGPRFVQHAIEEHRKVLDVNSQVWIAETLTRLWFSMRMNLLGCGVVIVIVSALLYLHDYLSPGMVGIAFTYAISVDSTLSILVGVWSWVEIAMVSPERIMEYATLKAEGSDRALVIDPSPHWPRRGEIRFDNVVFSYKQGAAPVLRGVTFSIGGHEKVGIVGRTGAGKSSLTMALFRINELSSGRIFVDDVDIATVSLPTLRSRLSIIPQAPVLFKGTLRKYMDPFDQYDDSSIWQAFAKVHLTEMIASLQGKLGFELAENGENFSVGERQMLCMARALLRNARIVIMDEATASIDHATEQKLQRMIAQDFEQATVLTIAHRLATVMDCDRILVLQDGQVVQFDTPQKLLTDGEGVFYQFAKEGGYLGPPTNYGFAGF